MAVTPNFARTYLLGNALPSTWDITGDITALTVRQLYLKAIFLDPKFARAYVNLAYTLDKGGSITLLDGTEMTKEQLIEKGASLEKQADSREDL